MYEMMHFVVHVCLSFAFMHVNMYNSCMYACTVLYVHVSTRYALCCVFACIHC